MPDHDLPGTLDTEHLPVRENDAPQRTTTLDTEAVSGQIPGLDLRGYELMERLGGGGMGDVYRASDPALGRDLAVKVMKAELQGHALAEQRFLREARVTGSLQHPGIVPIYNLGRLSDGRLHYTMRLVRGRTFADILKEKANRPEHLPELLTIFEKICQAVAYAHNKQVIHRDLKPANVMVGRFGEVQVMDWGLAKLLTAEDKRKRAIQSEGTRIYTEAGDTPPEQTRMGGEMGTPAYMPPEQALGEWDMVDERADVFALGAILCVILTGRPPYCGHEDHEALRKAKRGDLTEALTRLESCGADKVLVGLCRDCLASVREHRPRNAEQVAQRVALYQAEVQERLHRAELERAAAVARARGERLRRRWMLAASLFLLAGVVGTTCATGLALRAWKAEAQARKNNDELVLKVEAGLNGLADRLWEAGRIDEAIRLYEQNLKLKEIALGDNYEQIVGYRNWLAQKIGRTANAIRLFEQSLQLSEAKLGTDNPQTLVTRSQLAHTYQSTGRTDDAIRLHEQNLKLSEAAFGTADDRTLDYRNNLANAYREAGRIDEAIQLHKQNLQLSEARGEPGQTQILRYTLLSMANLGIDYQKAGRLKDTLELLENALERGRQRYGYWPDEISWVPGYLSQIYDQAGQYAKSESLHRESLRQAQQQFGADDLRTASALIQVGMNLLKQKKFAEAEPLLRQCLKVREARQPDDWTTFNVRSVLGEALLGQKKYAEAEPLLVQGYEGMKKRQNQVPPAYRLLRLDEALKRLVRLYEATEQKEKANDWRKKRQEAKAAQKKTEP
jgi:tetratricopeptide (TPR) repeat protein